MRRDTTRQGRDTVFISSLRVSSWKGLLVLTGSFKNVRFDLTVVTSSIKVSVAASEVEADWEVFSMREILEDEDDDEFMIEY